MLLEMPIFISVSLWKKKILLELNLWTVLAVGFLSIGSQVNRWDTTLIRLCGGNVLKVHWSANSNDTAVARATGEPQLQPGLPAVTYGSCQAVLSDKFDLLHLHGGVKQKAKVALELTRLKAKFIQKQSWLFFSLHTHTPLYKLLYIPSPCYNHIASLFRFLR